MLQSWYFLLLIISFVFTIYITLKGIYAILVLKQGNTINYSFLYSGISQSVWCIGHILNVYNIDKYGVIDYKYVYMIFIGVITTTLFTFMMGYSFFNPSFKFNFENIHKWGVFILPQLLSIAILITNNKHHAFFVKYSIYNTGIKNGWYFYVHALFSYSYMIYGTWYLYKARKKSVNSKKRKLIFLIILGITVPVLVNFIIILSIIRIPVYFTAISSIFCFVCWYFGIVQYGLLSIIKIAEKHFFENAPEHVVVISENLYIKSYNLKFYEFKHVVNLKKNVPIEPIINKIEDNDFRELFNKFLKIAKKEPFGSDVSYVFLDGSLICFEIKVQYIHEFECAIISLRDITSNNLEIIESYIKSIETRHDYVSGHCIRVAEYAVQIGLMLGLMKTELFILWLSGITHDIGKIGFSDNILKGSGIPNAQEFEQMKKHPEEGAIILEKIGRFKDVANIIRYHHEREDGNGYYKIKKENFSVLSKILIVADSYDSMTSGRLYKGTDSVLVTSDVFNRLIAWKEFVFTGQINDDGKKIFGFKRYISPIIASSMIKDDFQDLRSPDVGTQMNEVVFNAFVEVMVKNKYIPGYEKNGKFFAYTDQNGDFLHSEKLHDFVFYNENENRLDIKSLYYVDITIDTTQFLKLLNM